MNNFALTSCIILYSFAFGDDCYNILPGLQRVTHGIDITTLDLYPEDIFHQNGFKRPIFNFTCNNSKTWKPSNPIDTRGSFQMPDQFEMISTYPTGGLNQKTYIFNSFSDYKSSMSASVDVDVFFGLFSASGSYQKAQENILNISNSMTKVVAKAADYRVDFKHYLELETNNVFSQLVEELPATYRESPHSYNEIIRTFGTHYFEMAYFGGILQLQADMHSSYSYRFSEQQIKANAEATFFDFIKLNGGFNSESTSIDESFKQSSLSTSSFFGGNANLMKAVGLPLWWDTVTFDPYLTGGKLSPIYKLINGRKSVELGIATEIYGIKAHLQDLINILRLIKKEKGDSGCFYFYCATYILLIDQELSQVFPNITRVESYTDDVNNVLATVTISAQRDYLESIKYNVIDAIKMKKSSENNHEESNQNENVNIDNYLTEIESFFRLISGLFIDIKNNIRVVFKISKRNTSNSNLNNIPDIRHLIINNVKDKQFTVIVNQKIDEIRQFCVSVNSYLLK